MSDASNADVILNQAKEQEKLYDWLGVAEFCRKALNLLPETDFLKIAQVQEKIGYALYRASMQAESQEMFKERMRQAIKAHENAHGSYEKLVDEQKAAWMSRCEAVGKYLRYWLTTVPSERRKLLDECLELAEAASTLFWNLDNKLEFVRTYNELFLVFDFRIALEWDRQTVKSIAERGIEWGEKALETISELHEPSETAKTYFTLSTSLGDLGSFAETLEEQEKLRLKLLKYMKEAADLSKKAGDAYLDGIANFSVSFHFEEEEARQRTLECGRLTRDNLLIGWGLNCLAYMTYWNAEAMEESDKRAELYEKALQLYDEGQHHFSLVSYIFHRAGAIAPPSGHAEIYLNLARWETDPEKRRKFLEEAEETGIAAVKVAEDSNVPVSMAMVFHVMSGILLERTRLETDPVEKRSRLERALRCRTKSIQIMEQLSPYDYWNLGVFQGHLARLKSELADIQLDPDDKRRLLEESVSSWEKSLELIDKIIPQMERHGELSAFTPLRMSQDRYATLLMRLYDLTGKQEFLRRAIQISQKAIESANKLGLTSLTAESYWKIAKAQDNLGEHFEAAESFEHAYEGYAKAAEKIPQIRDFYEAQASYMRAWSDIQKARHHHERQEYGLASEHFQKAADMHMSLNHWSYLAPNYTAWAELERAEELSRREQDEEAEKSFEHAARLFDETRDSIQSQLGKIEDADEERMATNVFNAGDTRHEYCKARIAVEQAKILDKEGDHYSSSKKYGLAAEAFERISQKQKSEQEKKEIKFILILSRAWQKMTMAEAEASPGSYAEASGLFEQARDYVMSERIKMLVLGHSRFCKALEAGTRFADTRDQALHAAAIQYLASASNYYIKADLQTASEYAKATKLLFDAYAYLDTAEKEKDPDRKTKLYVMIERVLQTSAGSYTKAEHPEKREQILKLLEKAKEEQELAASMNEALHLPSIVSATTAFASPTQTQEEAVGSERFEHADVHVNIIANRKELNVGENLEVEIELANAGKGTALLDKIEEAIPNGFEITEKLQVYRVEGCNVNMKGRRLRQLKGEDVKLSLRPKRKGSFILRPVILYVDENGNAKSHKPEPITITVKELGLKGWIKGER